MTDDDLQPGDLVRIRWSRHLCKVLYVGRDRIFGTDEKVIGLWHLNPNFEGRVQAPADWNWVERVNGLQALSEQAE